MTPEKRTEQIVSEYLGWLRMDKRALEALVAEFGAAENEALERAASAIDKKIAACSYGVADCALCQARAQVARLVRSLKHPEGK